MAKIDAFKKITAQNGDQDVSRLLNTVQFNVEKMLAPLARTVILDGLLLENVTVRSTGINSIEHKLGRKVRGYILVSTSTPTSLYDYLNNTTYDSQKDLYLLLSSTADCVVNLWVF